jgi:hypothetical protein
MKNLKKFFKLGFCLFFLTVTSCLSLIQESMKQTENAKQTVGLHWSLGQFVNEWNEPLGKYFTRYDGTIKAMFFTRSDEVDIKQITFSEAQGLTFLLPSSSPMSSSQDTVVIIKLPNNEEKSFSGFFNTSLNRVRIEYSEELRDTLLIENVIIRLSFSNAYYRYQFTFPEKFQQAYDILIKKQSST